MSSTGSGRGDEGEASEVEVLVGGGDGGFEHSEAGADPSISDYEDMMDDCDWRAQGTIMASPGRTGEGELMLGIRDSLDTLREGAKLNRFEKKQRQKRLIYAVNYGESESKSAPQLGRGEDGMAGELLRSPRSILLSEQRKEERLATNQLPRNVSWADIHQSLPLTEVKEIPRGGLANEQRKSINTEYLLRRRQQRERMQQRTVVIFCGGFICVLILSIGALVAIGVLLFGDQK